VRLGILPAGVRASGGVYQASVAMLEALPRPGENDDDLVLFLGAETDVSPALLERLGWPSHTLPAARSPLERAGDRVRLALGLPMGAPPRDLDRIRRRPALARTLRNAGVDLMLYPAPTTVSFETGVPYALAIWDLQHRLQPEFPEVSANGEWEAREYLYRNGARLATLILVDSDVGKEDVLEYYGPYGVTADRIEVLPFVPPSYLATDVPAAETARVRAAHGLREEYLFYPAQFWPHKNHVRIVEALGLLRSNGLRPHVAFAGGGTGAIRARTVEEIIETARRCGVDEQVQLLGYVADEDLPGLYAGSLGLVMPTFFGPANIPVVEAWAVGCPVLTSDIRGVREQAGEAAVLVDPRSVEAIADGVRRLVTDAPLRADLAERGRRRMAEYTPDDYRRRLREILGEAKRRVS
jgi:glycosyltransferase involved in cell wall biosynthesis